MRHRERLAELLPAFDLTIAPGTVGAAGPSVALEVCSWIPFFAGSAEHETTMSVIGAIHRALDLADAGPRYESFGQASRRLLGRAAARRQRRADVRPR